MPLAAATALGLGLAALGGPLLGVHGVESALVLGVVLPPVAAAAAARTTLGQLERWAPPTAAGLIARGVGVATILWAVPTVILAANGLRVPQCTPGEGLAFVVAGPGIGVALAGLVGVLAALIVPRRLAVPAAAAIPIASALAEVGGLYTTPAIFAFDHFAGWFPGTLYDRGTTFPAVYPSFRAITAAITLGLVGAVFGVLDPDRRAGRLAAATSRPLALAAVLIGTATALAGAAWGPALGHAGSVDHIVTTLGASEEGARCVLHAPREMPRDKRRRILADCDFRVGQVEADLGVRGTPRVTAFLFRSAGEKRRLMGAAQTLIAKPWRHEVYLQDQGWPHPVLHHEVAHVVAGQVGSGPMKVAGRFGGLLPDPALIEGTAVALAFRSRGQLTPHEWSRALLELDRLPRLSSLGGLRFLLRPPRDAYTVTGSFLRFVLSTRGAEAVRDVYRAGTFEALGDVREAERAWRRFLRSDVSLAEGAMERARWRFGRPTVFATACPHRVARLQGELGAARADGDHDRALSLADELLAIDPKNPGVLASRAGSLAWLGREGEAEAVLRVLEGAPVPVQVRARERVADAAWARGDRQGAASAYGALLALPQDGSAARALEVKRLGVAGVGADAVRGLLVRDGGRAAPPALAVHLARRLDERRDALGGLGAYLEARQLFFVDAFPEAAARLEEALNVGLPTDRLRVEALRLLGLAHVGAAVDARGDTAGHQDRDEGARRLAAAERAAEALRRDPEATVAQRRAADTLVDRVAFTRRR